MKKDKNEEVFSFYKVDCTCFRGNLNLGCQSVIFEFFVFFNEQFNEEQ